MAIQSFRCHDNFFHLCLDKGDIIPDTDTYWVDNSLELFFENQEDVIARYLKENGYQLISMTGEK